MKKKQFGTMNHINGKIAYHEFDPKLLETNEEGNQKS